MKKRKLLCWISLGTLLLVVLFLAAACRANRVETLAEATPNLLLTALPTLFPGGFADSFPSGYGCAGDRYFTSLPAKCMTLEGMRDVGPRTGEIIPIPPPQPEP